MLSKYQGKQKLSLKFPHNTFATSIKSKNIEKKSAACLLSSLPRAHSTPIQAHVLEQIIKHTGPTTEPTTQLMNY